MASTGRNRSRVLCGLALLALAGCQGGSEPEKPDSEPRVDSTPVQDSEEADCVHAEDQPMRTMVPSEYADMCEPELGVVPTLDCAAGIPIPVTVDGVQVYEDPGPGNCDEPHGGQCTPGSTLQRLQGVDPDGTERPEVIWIGLCRHDTMGEGNPVQLIGHNTDTGATCFFGRSDVSGWTTYEGDRLVGVMPGPDDPDFDQAYTVPDDDDLCVTCHQSGPYIHNAWTNAARSEDGERVVPVITGFKAPYFVVGAPEWDLRTAAIEGNACLDCHRVGRNTVLLLAEDGWTADGRMPPSDPGSQAADFAALQACWEDGPEETEGCEWIVPPAGTCEQRVVGEEYPNEGPPFDPSDDKQGRGGDEGEEGEEGDNAEGG